MNNLDHLENEMGRKTGRANVGGRDPRIGRHDQRRPAPPPHARKRREAVDLASGGMGWDLAASNRGQFRPGENANPLGPTAGETFRRGPDRIARGSWKLLLAVMFYENREGIYNYSCRIARGELGASAYISLMSEFGDRTEGKPVKAVLTQSRRTTVFREAEHRNVTRAT